MKSILLYLILSIMAAMFLSARPKTTTKPLDKMMCSPSCELKSEELVCQGNKTSEHLRQILECVTEVPSINVVVMRVYDLICTCQWYHFATNIVDRKVHLITTPDVRSCLERASPICHKKTTPSPDISHDYEYHPIAEPSPNNTSPGDLGPSHWDSILGDTKDWVAIKKVTETPGKDKTYDELKTDDLIYIIIILVSVMTPVICGLVFLVMYQVQKKKTKRKVIHDEIRKDDKPSPGLFGFLQSKKKKTKTDDRSRTSKDKVPLLNENTKDGTATINKKLLEQMKKKGMDSDYVAKVNKVFGEDWKQFPSYGPGTFPDIDGDETPAGRNNNNMELLLVRSDDSEVSLSDESEDGCTVYASSEIGHSNHSSNNHARSSEMTNESDSTLVPSESSVVPCSSVSFMTLDGFSEEESKTKKGSHENDALTERSYTQSSDTDFIDLPGFNAHNRNTINRNKSVSNYSNNLTYPLVSTIGLSSTSSDENRSAKEVFLKSSHLSALFPTKSPHDSSTKSWAFSNTSCHSDTSQTDRNECISDHTPQNPLDGEHIDWQCVDTSCLQNACISRHRKNPVTYLSNPHVARTLNARVFDQPMLTNTSDNVGAHGPNTNRCLVSPVNLSELPLGCSEETVNNKNLCLEYPSTNNRESRPCKRYFGLNPHHVGNDSQKTSCADEIRMERLFKPISPPQPTNTNVETTKTEKKEECISTNATVGQSLCETLPTIFDMGNNLYNLPYITAGNVVKPQPIIPVSFASTETNKSRNMPISPLMQPQMTISPNSNLIVSVCSKQTPRCTENKTNAFLLPGDTELPSSVDLCDSNSEDWTSCSGNSSASDLLGEESHECSTASSTVIPPLELTHLTRKLSPFFEPICDFSRNRNTDMDYNDLTINVSQEGVSLNQEQQIYIIDRLERDPSPNSKEGNICSSPKTLGVNPSSWEDCNTNEVNPPNPVFENVNFSDKPRSLQVGASLTSTGCEDRNRGTLSPKDFANARAPESCNSKCKESGFRSKEIGESSLAENSLTFVSDFSGFSSVFDSAESCSDISVGNSEERNSLFGLTKPVEQAEDDCESHDDNRLLHYNASYESLLT